jgi:hypothetical protein
MAAGRLQVTTGQTIASAWGNTAWDHTVQCFASATDRTNQFPNPQPGAVSFTEDSKTLWVYLNGTWQPLTPTATATGIASLALPTAGTQNSTVVTFPTGRFSAALLPIVLLQRVTGFSSSATTYYWPGPITATGFTLNGVSSAVGGAASIAWLAVQAP